MPHPAVAMLVGGHPVGHRLIGYPLQVHVQGRVDTQPGLVNLLGAEALLQLLTNFLLEPRRNRALRLRDMEAQRSLARLLGLDVCDHPVRLHFAEHQVAAAHALLWIEQRRIGRRPLRQSRQQRGFGEVYILGVLAEIELRGSLEAVHPVPQVDLVAVESKDLLLGESAFDLDGKIGLLDLARSGALRGEKQVARQLHRQGRGSLRASMATHVVPHRSHDAEDVHPPVRFKRLVFNGDHRLAQHRGKIVVIDQNAPLQSKGADDAALAVVEIGGGGWAVVLQIGDLRQIGRVHKRKPRQRSGDDSQHDERNQRDPARQLAAAGRRLILLLRLFPPGAIRCVA